MKSSFDGRSDSLRQRFGRFCHFDAVGRFTSSAIFGFIMRRNELLLRIKRERIRHWLKMEGACRRTMCQLWLFQKNQVFPMSLRRRRATDCESEVPIHRETGRRKFQNVFNLSKKASLVSSRLTQSRGGTTCS